MRLARFLAQPREDAREHERRLARTARVEQDRQPARSQCADDCVDLLRSTDENGASSSS